MSNIPRPSVTELDQALRSLQESHHVFVLALLDMVPVVRTAAEEGDPLAKVVFARYEAALTGMQAENIAASAVVAEANRG
jgi:hypothetical protein